MTFHELYLNSHKLNLSFFYCMHACKESIETVAKLLSRDHLSDVNRCWQTNWHNDKKSFSRVFFSAHPRVPFCAISVLKNIFIHVAAIHEIWSRAYERQFSSFAGETV